MIVARTPSLPRGGGRRRTRRFRLALLFLFAAVASSLGSSSSSVRRVVVVGGTHGNEYTGVWCIKSLEATRHVALEVPYPSLEVTTLLGNPEAHMMNRRFVDTDLNREFSGEKLLGSEEAPPETVESLRAKEVDAILGPKFEPDGEGADVVIDLHSTTSNMGTTVIIPEGDALMAQAAAYVLHKCGREEGGARVLLHTIPNREDRPNLSSAGRHGFTVEVGPVPQGVVRHDAVEKTERALHSVLEFLERRNSEGEDAVLRDLRGWYPAGRAPCFRSAPAKAEGEMSGKIQWPSDPDNPNFPGAMVHKSLQDRDFLSIRRGDPLFVRQDGSVVTYDGSHGDEVYLIFVNEGGYYYKSSGTGIGVAVAAEFDLVHGTLIADGTAVGVGINGVGCREVLVNGAVVPENEECVSHQSDVLE